MFCKLLSTIAILKYAALNENTLLLFVQRYLVSKSLSERVMRTIRMGGGLKDWSGVGRGWRGGGGGAQPQLPGFSVFASIALLQIRFLGIQFHSFFIKKYHWTPYLQRNAWIDQQRHPNKKREMRHTGNPPVQYFRKEDSIPEDKRFT